MSTSGKDKEAQKRGEPDGAADSFLRQKQAQLRENREREKHAKDKEIRLKPEADAKQVTGDQPRTTHLNKKTAEKIQLSSHTQLQKRGTEKEKIPPFYFPSGRPNSTNDYGTMVQRIKDMFAKVDGGKVQKQHIAQLTKVLPHLARPDCM